MWKPEDFEVAYPSGPKPVAGYTYRGLGLFMRTEGSVTGKRPPLWNLSHLGTGHNLAIIEGFVAVSFPIATAIAEAGDWEFISLEGYKDRFPDAPERLREVCERHGSRVKSFAGSNPASQWDERNRAVAQQIASNRP